jgi:hypothetical protein
MGRKTYPLKWIDAWHPAQHVPRGHQELKYNLLHMRLVWCWLADIALGIIKMLK